jgi:hypothetical protein
MMFDEGGQGVGRFADATLLIADDDDPRPSLPLLRESTCDGLILTMTISSIRPAWWTEELKLGQTLALLVAAQ